MAIVGYRKFPHFIRHFTQYIKRGNRILRSPRYRRHIQLQRILINPPFHIAEVNEAIRLAGVVGIDKNHFVALVKFDSIFGRNPSRNAFFVVKKLHFVGIIAPQNQRHVRRPQKMRIAHNAVFGNQTVTVLGIYTEGVLQKGERQKANEQKTKS